jgi:hypothetical protein
MKRQLKEKEQEKKRRRKQKRAQPQAPSIEKTQVKRVRFA